MSVFHHCLGFERKYYIQVYIKHSKFTKAANGLEQSRPVKFSVEFFFLITTLQNVKTVLI